MNQIEQIRAAGIASSDSLAVQAASTVIKAGSMLLIAGAEVYRVEETMQKLGLSIPGITECTAYVSATGIMCTICTSSEMATKVARIYSGKRNLSIVNAINALSRSSVIHHYSVEEIQEKLREISRIEPWPAHLQALFGAVGAGGFAVFFWGQIPDVIASFVIGLMVYEAGQMLSHLRLNQFLVILIQSFAAAGLARVSHILYQPCDVNTIIISVLMLLVPGLSITNGIRDTMMGDYLSGTVRFTESLVIAASIAIGAGLGIYLF